LARLLLVGPAGKSIFTPKHTDDMASAEERAVAFKNEGNKAFAAHDWPTAIDFYTKAIELNDKEPTYFSNRAQVSPCESRPAPSLLA
jgi:hypothetical protein